MKNRIIIIILMIMSLSLIGYIVYDKMNDNNTKFPEINVEILSMEKPVIYLEGSSYNLMIKGEMNISYDEDIYDVVVISGYCLDQNNIRYNVHGPGSGAISFYNNDKAYVLVNAINSIDGDVIYPNGTKKNLIDVDWSTVRIKSCKIEKAIAYFFDNTTTVETKINYEKSF